MRGMKGRHLRMSPRFLAWPLDGTDENSKCGRKSRFVQGEDSKFRFELGPSRVPGMVQWRCLGAYGEARVVAWAALLTRGGEAGRRGAEGGGPTPADMEGTCREAGCGSPSCNQNSAIVCQAARVFAYERPALCSLVGAWVAHRTRWVGKASPGTGHVPGRAAYFTGILLSCGVGATGTGLADPARPWSASLGLQEAGFLSWRR